jgi:hypothetical protein
VSPARAREDRDARQRRLRAWRLRGEPDKPRRREGRTVLEAKVLMAHHSGDLVLGGDLAGREAA